MMCELDTESLYAWVDGEAGSRTERITAHQSRCLTCRGRLQALHAVQNDLGRRTKAATPQLDPLIALQHIREHPEAKKRQRLAGPGRDAWEFAWGVHRGRCLAALFAGGAMLCVLARAAML